MRIDYLRKFSDIKILVLGDFMVDEYVRGSVERISPEAPVPVVKEESRSYVPGGAGNVVRNLCALEAHPLLSGLIGIDEAGSRLKKDFAQLKVESQDLLLLELKDRPTTLKTRIMAGNHQLCRLDREFSGELSASEEEELINQAIARLPEVQAIIISDYDKGTVTPKVIEAITTEARQRDIITAVDPQVSRFSFYQNVDLITPNHHEAGGFLARKLISDADIETGCAEIAARLGVKMVLITRGEKGMSLFHSGEHFHIETRAREVFDVTGAGDTVISVFTLALAAGATPKEAAELSNLAAGLVVARTGAAVVTPRQLQEAAAASD